MELWNRKDLDLPPRNTYKASDRSVDIDTLRKITHEAYNTFNNDSYLKESALLSRYIYRMKLKFRNDHGLKAMEKMNRALLQCLRMDIPAMFNNFYSMIPHKYGPDTFLPTLNMLHYILVRLQGLAKLLIRIVECAKTAADSLEGRISIGHLWKVAFVCFSTVSKIFILTKQQVKSCCKFYNGLIPFTETLRNVGSKWLADEYSFPRDLKLWLDVDWLDQEEICIPKPKTLKIPTIFDIADDSESDVEYCGKYVEVEDEIEFVDEYIEVGDRQNQNSIESRKSNVIRLGSLTFENKNISRKDEFLQITPNVEDIGEVIELPADDEVKVNTKKNKKKKLKPKASQIKNEKTNTKNVSLKNSRQVNPKEHIGETIASIDLTNTKKKKNKKKKKKTQNDTNVIEDIKTLNDLKRFGKDFNTILQQNANTFIKFDRLQRNMLQKSLKKYIKKARLSNNNQAKVETCIAQAKGMLKSFLL